MALEDSRDGLALLLNNRSERNGRKAAADGCAGSLEGGHELGHTHQQTVASPEEFRQMHAWPYRRLRGSLREKLTACVSRPRA